MSFPHTTNCPTCEKNKICNYCGKGMALQGWMSRCTQGRCAECHGKRCTPGGATSPGHGSGFTIEEVKIAWDNETNDHKKERT